MAILKLVTCGRNRKHQEHTNPFAVIRIVFADQLEEQSQATFLSSNERCNVIRADVRPFRVHVVGGGRATDPFASERERVLVLIVDELERQFGREFGHDPRVIRSSLSERKVGEGVNYRCASGALSNARPLM